MADNKYISLKISGNQYANSGFMPLASFNSPTFDVRDSGYGGFSENSYFFSVVIEMTQVVYMLIKNNVRSCNGAFREGTLKIAIAIPKNYKLVDGKTPYDALIRIKDAFMSLCMTCKDPIKGIYEFNSSAINPGVLDSVAQEFPLENVAGPHHPMTPGGPKGFVMIPEDMIGKLMGDVQYQEFSSYGEILIAPSVMSTNYTPIVNLTIPRAPRFNIVIDDILQDGYVEDPEEDIPVKGKKDSRYYDNTEIKFSISDIRNGNIPNVTIDEEKEIINISTEALSRQKQKQVKVVFDQGAEKYFYTFQKDFQLMYGQKVINLSDFTFTLKGSEIAWLEAPSHFNASFARKDEYAITGCSLIENAAGEYQLKVATIKVNSNVTRDILMPDNKQRPKDSDIVKIEVNLQERPDPQYIHLFNNKSEKIQSISVKGAGQCAFYIKRQKGIDQMYVSYESSDKIYTTEVKYDRRPERYYASDFKAEKKSFYAKVIEPGKTLFAALIALLLGAIIGLALSLVIPLNELFQKEPVEICKYCYGEFDGPEALSRHLSGAHLHKCDQCTARFDSSADLQAHVAKVHPHKCEKCEKVFGSEAELQTHMNEEHLKHACGKCDARFGSKQELTAHKAAEHPASAPTPAPAPAGRYKCQHDKCKKSFDSETDLYNHVVNDHGRYFCCHPDCGQNMWFTTKTDLDNHIRSKHPSSER